MEDADKDWGDEQYNIFCDIELYFSYRQLNFKISYSKAVKIYILATAAFSRQNWLRFFPF